MCGMGKGHQVKHVAAIGKLHGESVIHWVHNCFEAFQCLGGLTWEIGHLKSSCRKLTSSMEMSGRLGCKTACLLTCISAAAATCWVALTRWADLCWLSAVPHTVLYALLLAVLLAEMPAVLPVPGEAVNDSPPIAACWAEAP